MKDVVRYLERVLKATKNSFGFTLFFVEKGSFTELNSIRCSISVA